MGHKNKAARGPRPSLRTLPYDIIERIADDTDSDTDRMNLFKAVPHNNEHLLNRLGTWAFVAGSNQNFPTGFYTYQYDKDSKVISRVKKADATFQHLRICGADRGQSMHFMEMLYAFGELIKHTTTPHLKTLELSDLTHLTAPLLRKLITSLPAVEKITVKRCRAFMLCDVGFGRSLLPDQCKNPPRLLLEPHQQHSAGEMRNIEPDSAYFGQITSSTPHMLKLYGYHPYQDHAIAYFTRGGYTCQNQSPGVSMLKTKEAITKAWEKFITRVKPLLVNQAPDYDGYDSDASSDRTPFGAHSDFSKLQLDFAVAIGEFMHFGNVTRRSVTVENFNANRKRISVPDAAAFDCSGDLHETEGDTERQTGVLFTKLELNGRDDRKTCYGCRGAEAERSTNGFLTTHTPLPEMVSHGLMLDILRARNNFDDDHDRRDGYLMWSDEWDFSGDAKPRTARDEIKMSGVSVREQAKASFDDLAEMQFGLDLKICKPALKPPKPIDFPSDIRPEFYQTVMTHALGEVNTSTPHANPEEWPALGGAISKGGKAQTPTATPMQQTSSTAPLAHRANRTTQPPPSAWNNSRHTPQQAAPTPDKSNATLPPHLRRGNFASIVAGTTANPSPVTPPKPLLAVSSTTTEADQQSAEKRSSTVNARKDSAQVSPSGKTLGIAETSKSPTASEDTSNRGAEKVEGGDKGRGRGRKRVRGRGAGNARWVTLRD